MNLAAGEDKESTRKVVISRELSRTLKALQSSQKLDEIILSNELSNKLCDVLEAIFLHGLREPMTYKFKIIMQQFGQTFLLNFWKFVLKFTHKDVIVQIQQLRQIKTEIGFCRAWIRLALNDGLLCSYIDAIVADQKTLEAFYYPTAFLRDLEQPGIVEAYVQGLMAFQFELSYNSSVLNSWMPTPLQLAGLLDEDDTPSAIISDDRNAVVPVLDNRIVSSSSIPAHIITETDVVTETEPHNGTPEVQQKTQTPPECETSKNSLSYCEREIISQSLHKIENAAEIETFQEAASQDSLKKTSSSTIMVKENTQCNSAISQESLPVKADTFIEGLHKDGGNDVLNHPSGNNQSLGNSLGGVLGWSSEFKKLDRASNPDQSPQVENAESFETLLKNYRETKSLSPVPFGHIVDDLFEESSPQLPKSITASKKQKKENVDYVDGFEVLGSSIVLSVDSAAQNQFALINKICTEKGIASQNYQCNGCPSPIGIVYGKALVCVYDGCYYCKDCHQNDEFYIPSRVIYNWDFNKHKVSKMNYEFLKEIQDQPLLNIAEVNPGLYDLVQDIKDTKILRMQLAHLSSYLFTCKQSVAETLRRSVWPKEYLYEDIHLYSLMDLIQVASGQLQQMLRKTLKLTSKHVYQCGLCSQKGFICEVCKNSKVIYPFEVDATHRCDQCKAVYHKMCMSSGAQCPRCERRRQRIMKVGPISISPEPDYDVIPWEAV